MPDYKKKKHKKFSLTAPVTRLKKRGSKNKDTEREKEGYQRNSNLKVVEGKRREKKRRLYIISGIVATIVAILIILELTLAAGLFESIRISVKLWGSGSYPITLKSTETLNTVTKGSYYYVLSNTHLSAFSKSGKELFTFEHGFENPVLKTSASRSLVYDQGGKDFYVFDIDGLLYTMSTEQPIITAAVADRGRFAVATLSDKYNSEVKVFDKDANSIYEWYSAKDTISSVALSNNGEKLAVATFNVTDSKFNSRISVLNYSSATPEKSESFENTQIRTINNAFKSYFTVVTDNEVKTYEWDDFTSKSYKSDYNVMFFDSHSSGFVAVFARENDRTDNRVVVFNKKGNVSYNFTYNGNINDITVLKSNVYIMNETEIYWLNNQGKVVSKATCGFGGKNIFAVSSDSVAVITDNEIQKVSLVKE